MSSPQATLLDDSYAPITSAIGFLNTPFEHALEAVQAWHTQNRGAPEVEPGEGTLEERLLALEPLTLTTLRQLWIGCADPDWVAVFDCNANGSDPISAIGHLSRTIQVRGLTVTSIPTATTSGRHGRWAARQFQLFGPVETHFLNYVRTLSVTQDGSKWRFDANGTVQHFEDESAYTRRRIAERLTPEMLIDYCHAVGVRPFDEDFYRGPTALVTTRAHPAPDDLSLTLHQARQRLGLAP